MQNLLFESLFKVSGPDLFILSALYINGYGCERNTAEALQCLQQAAGLVNHNARAYMYRIFATYMSTDKDENPGAKYLSDYAKVGSRVAFEDYRKIDPPDKVNNVRRFVTDAGGGVGAAWLNRSEMLHGYTQLQWIDDDWSREQIQKTDSLPDLVVNKRGDTILHFLAMCDRWKPFQSLILDYGMDVNLRNPLGETPLLCACRAEQGGVAILCLQQFKADASIAANKGETPLHWLVSFPDNYIEPLTQDLISNGAKIDAMTHETVMHSEFPGTIDMDLKLPGTPLSWAVHDNRPHVVKTLLKRGANPNGDKTWMNPIGCAAYYHHDECLSIMIKHLEGKVIQTTTDGRPELRHALMYGSVVQDTIHSADRFSMILRNGPEYLARLHATLGLLQEKTKLINFQSSFGGNVLYYAVSEAHDEVVEYMLKHNWCVETLNDGCGLAGRTPVLEAVRWNRRPMYQMLLDSGADIKTLAANPFRPAVFNWSALHLFAHEGHIKDVSLVDDLVANGVPVDGSVDAPALFLVPSESTNETLDSEVSSLTINNETKPIFPCETPFAVALRHNGFPLASALLSHGAIPNALTMSSGLFVSLYPLTVHGHIIISNARYSSARLQCLLNLDDIGLGFIVEPKRRLSALHRAAMAYQDIHKVDGGIVRREEFDFDTSADILYELLLKWKRKEELDFEVWNPR